MIRLEKKFNNDNIADSFMIALAIEKNVDWKRDMSLNLGMLSSIRKKKQNNRKKYFQHR